MVENQVQRLCELAERAPPVSIVTLLSWRATYFSEKRLSLSDMSCAVAQAPMVREPADLPRDSADRNAGRANDFSARASPVAKLVVVDGRDDDFVDVLLRERLGCREVARDVLRGSGGREGARQP